MTRTPHPETVPAAATPAGAISVSTSALTRRSFLVSAGGLSVAVAFGGLAADGFGAVMAPASDGTYKPNVWVSIADDGTISIISPASEMGQGVMTSMPLLIAEDMDADWTKVRIIQAPVNKDYGNPKFGFAQLTGGSRTTPGYYQELRLVGAQTRKVILASAADLLKVPVGELMTEPNVVIHKRSKKKISYGELAKSGKLPDPLPQATEADLKPVHQWRYIGNRKIPRIDVPAKGNGTAQFGIDVQLPNMVYGAVLRTPVQGEKPVSVDDAAARTMKGILQIVPLPYGVGIVGETVEATKKAKDSIKVTWSTGAKARSYTSDKVLEDYRTIANDLSRKGVDVFKEGDAETAIAGAAKVLAVDYMTDHVYHATMEPMNATAVINGEALEIWAPTQSPSVTQGFGARTAGTTPDKVKVHTTLLGGGFGRKIEPDFIIDAVLLAKTMPGRPVKVIWSREDDVQHDKYRPLEAQHIQVGLDAKNNIVGWRHRIVAESIFARVFPAAFEKGGGQDGSVTEGLEFNYKIPAHHVEYIRQERGQDVGFWRAVGPGYTKFGVECMIDEIAQAKRVDPLTFRLELLKEQPRAQKVLRTVAEMAGWRKKRQDRALGLAYSDAWGAHCAQIAEISLDRKSGEIRVHNVWCVVDPGVAVQPWNIEAQMMGAITHGASHALYEQINFVNGEVQESNFDTYRVMRMSEAPDVHVRVMPTPENAPTGLGEVGLPPIGAAIANGFARLTGGVRLRHYPFLPDRVKAALKT
jgi:isoquinoline 1-oxidoreductase beta subunit